MRKVARRMFVAAAVAVMTFGPTAVRWAEAAPRPIGKH